MRQRPNVEEPIPQSPQITPLHPVLSNALASLDIQLEEELARYRRLRTVSGDRPSRRTSRYAPTQPLDLISVSARGGRTQPSEDIEAPDNASQRIPLASPAASENGVSGNATPMADYPATSPVAIAPDLQTSDLTIALQAETSPLTSDSGDAQNSLPQDPGGDLARPMKTQGLDDYLESSEELLRSLEEEEAAVQAEHSFMQNLLTPLGAGSMLLLLLSSAMFGYMVMNPPSLGNLFASRNSSSSGTNGGFNTQTSMVKPQPNLASKEFKDLNLDTLGTLEADSTKPLVPSATTSPSNTATTPGSPTVNPNRPDVANTSAASTAQSSQPSQVATSPTRPQPAPAAPGRSAPVKTYQPPQPARSYSTPARTTVAPPPTNAYKPPVAPKKPAPVTPAASNAPSPSSSFDYKVVTHYDSDRTLQEVKKVVPDAYLKNFPDGARIQLGASQTQADAEAKAQKLRNQGISAEVYKP